ncbi:DUF6456 domain-containing protein [Roseomonas elaeocarpi]|uniref:DUF6456 domain-containing protein n=1 Tax=Roseomonas elaeocarpi TaxID=907779 RepID=A0ABV6JZ43_9PROT
MPLEHHRRVDREPELIDLKRGDRLEAKAGHLVRELVHYDRVLTGREAVARAVAVGTDAHTPERPQDKEFAADPDDPNRTIRRHRRHDPVRRLYDGGDLTAAHWVAAEKFRDLYALAEGAREDSGPGALAPWQKGHLSQRQLDAMTERTAAIQAVGLRLSAVFLAAVIQQERLKQIEKDLCIRHGRAAHLLREALDLLADHWTRR